MTIKIPSNSLEQCLGITNNVSDAYWLHSRCGGVRTVKSVRFLADEIASQFSTKPIRIQRIRLNSKNEHVKAFFVKHADYYDVCVLENLNFCWERFAITKELFHVFLDDPEYRTIELVKHTEALYTAVEGSDDVGPEPGITSESLAEIAAMEFLFPFSDRQRVGKIRQSSEIAEQYKIPLVLVEKYLTNSNMDLFAPFCRGSEE